MARPVTSFNQNHSRGKVVIGLFLAATVGALGFVGFYLPYHSDQAKARAQRVAEGKEPTQRSNVAPGSYWKNLDTHAKGQQGGHQ